MSTTTTKEKVMIQSEILRVDPDVAHGILGHNERNRHVSQAVVDRYADAMRRGLWSFDGQPLRIDPDGRLLDGQHRLLAIIASETAQDFVVLRGILPEAQVTMDTGRKRSLADALSMRGIPSPAGTAALLTLLVGVERIGLSPTTFRFAVQPADALAFFDSHSDDVAAAVRLGDNMKRRTGAGTGRVWALAAYLFRELDADDAEGFFAAVTEGANLASDSPILHLRNALAALGTSNRRLTMRPESVLAIIVKTWNAYRAGTPMRVLKYSPGGAKPEAYPVPA